MKLRSLIALVFVVVAGYALAQDVNNALIERIRPAGQVCMVGQECGSATAAVASGPRDGKAVYETACFACHGAGVLNAPRLAQAGDWTDRLDQGLAGLTLQVINGKGAMPAMGTCTNCSEDEIEAAVQYMLDTL